MTSTFAPTLIAKSVRIPVQDSGFPLSPVPSLERSLFDWMLTALSVSTLVFGVLGWSFAQRASAAEVPAAERQAQLASGTAADLGEAVVPSCYFPENPALCFTSVGDGGEELIPPAPIVPLIKLDPVHVRPSYSPLAPEPPVLPLFTSPLV